VHFFLGHHPQVWPLLASSHAACAFYGDVLQIGVDFDFGLERLQDMLSTLSKTFALATHLNTGGFCGGGLRRG
jgi:hypothetical protein